MRVANNKIVARISQPRENGIHKIHVWKVNSLPSSSVYVWSIDFRTIKFNENCSYFFEPNVETCTETSNSSSIMLGRPEISPHCSLQTNCNRSQWLCGQAKSLFFLAVHGSSRCWRAENIILRNRSGLIDDYTREQRRGLKKQVRLAENMSQTSCASAENSRRTSGNKGPAMSLETSSVLRRPPDGGHSNEDELMTSCHHDGSLGCPSQAPESRGRNWGYGVWSQNDTASSHCTIHCGGVELSVEFKCFKTEVEIKNVCIDFYSFSFNLFDILKR